MSAKSHLLISIIFTISLISSPTIADSEENAEMKVHFIDVGQGDSILIQTPSNKAILIDGGPPNAGGTIIAYLKELQIKKIDLLIATHPDIDHIGGLPYVMKSIKIDKVIDSGKPHFTRTYAKYINQIRNQQIPFTIAKINEKIVIDSLVKIRILNTYEHNKNNNQSSIVLKVGFGKIDFLFMGDVEHGQEIDLLENYNVQAEIVKVAHHGSNTSSSLKFLQKVNPEVALLTYSKINDFGHPVNRVIENLSKINAHIYSTAVYGNVVIHTNGEDYYVFPEKSPADGLTNTAK